MGVLAFLASPSTRSLARPPRDAPAAFLRARGRSSTHWQRPGHHIRVAMLVEVVCTRNGAQHQTLHKRAAHASEQHIPGPHARARTKRDTCNHASPAVHARTAPQKPTLAHIAHSGSMSGTTLHKLPHAATHARARDSLRVPSDAAPQASAHATRAAAARAAARQKRPCAARRTPAAFLLSSARAPRPANLRATDE